MTSHYTWGSMTTLHDFGVVMGQYLDTFFWTLTISWSRLLACVWSGPYHRLELYYMSQLQGGKWETSCPMHCNSLLPYISSNGGNPFFNSFLLPPSSLHNSFWAIWHITRHERGLSNCGKKLSFYNMLQMVFVIASPPCCVEGTWQAL